MNAVASALSNKFSFDIFAEAIADSRVSLMVERLYATPTNNSDDAKRYEIIVDGYVECIPTRHETIDEPLNNDLITKRKIDGPLNSGASNSI